MRNLWQKELDAIRAIEEAGVGEAGRKISIFRWGIACIAGAMFWVAIAMAVV